MADVTVKNGMINYHELSHILKNGKVKIEPKVEIKIKASPSK